MNTTVWNMQKYINQEYGIDFKLTTYPNGNGELEYKNNKTTYNLHCDYAFHPEIELGVEYWSIYYDYMNYNKWHGDGGTYIDEGIKTIDKIMQEWGFKKKNQTTIFDFIGE